MPKLVNLGSLCIDFVYQVPQLAGAGETIASTGRELFCGGKGLNQSLAAARAGATVRHFGAVGEDGDMLVAALSEAGVNTAGVLRMAESSGHAVIQVDIEGQNSIVISGGTNRKLPESHLRNAVDALAEGDWLLLQNEINDLELVIALAAERGARIALNLAPPDARIHNYPIERLALLIVNEAEANALAGTDSPSAAFDALIARFPGVSLLLTMGRDGLLLYDHGQGQRLQAGTYAVEAVDETAAGDAFVGYLMAGLVAGESVGAAAQSASAAGALAVTRAGAAPSIPSFEEVRALQARHPDAVVLSELDPG